MDVNEIRKKYPEAKNYSDKKIMDCHRSADLLARMFMQYLENKYNKKTPKGGNPP